MASEIKIVIPASSDPRIVKALSWKAGYSPTVTNAEGKQIPNPVTAEEACRKYLISRIYSDITDYEGMLAAKASADKVASEVVIT